jgi:DNA-directed RNA polymerase beta' subunit
MKLNIKMQYPYNEDYEYQTSIERINLDKEMEHDMEFGKGFFIKEPPPLNKALKRSDSIYSEKFMKTMQDPDAYSDRYSCECGHLQGRDYAGMECPICKKIVKFIGDDFEIFGWIHLKDEYSIIHPNLYKSLASYIGPSNLETILEPEIDLNENGKPISTVDKQLDKKTKKRKYTRRAKKVDETYANIGMIEFKNKFDEIIEYFHDKNKQKKIELYEDIKANKDILFIHNIPVYSTGLRPFKTEGKRFTFEGTNAKFNIMAKVAAKINDDSLSIYKTRNYRNKLLWDIQEKYNSLYSEIENICSNKKGTIRMLIGGRCGFTSRLVIIPDPTLRIDEVKLSYYSLVELLQQSIINILSTSYNISYAEAYMRLFRAQLEPDKRIREIIENFIRANNGINVLVNRN